MVFNIFTKVPISNQYIYITEASEAPTIFHISTILKKKKKTHVNPTKKIIIISAKKNLF